MLPARSPSAVGYLTFCPCALPKTTIRVPFIFLPLVRCFAQFLSNLLMWQDTPAFHGRKCMPLPFLLQWAGTSPLSKAPSHPTDVGSATASQSAKEHCMVLAVGEYNWWNTWYIALGFMGWLYRIGLTPHVSGQCGTIPIYTPASLGWHGGTRWWCALNHSNDYGRLMQRSR